MTAVASMARDKKNEKPAAGTAGDEKKNVKVRPEFHRRLKTVAALLGKEMGELVEREMEEFLTRELGALQKRSGS